MISNKGVLVLGAGASHPHGFALGSEIVRSILKDGISSSWICKKTERKAKRDIQKSSR
jgi:hypothetical protein